MKTVELTPEEFKHESKEYYSQYLDDIKNHYVWKTV